MIPLPGISISYPLLVGFVFILGALTGGLSNVTSGGAGVFTIYVLTNYAGLVIQNSTGTVLAASTVIVFIGVVSFYRRRQVDMRLALTVGLSGVVGAFLAARWASGVGAGSLEHAFGAFTLALSGYTSYLFINEWRRHRDRLVGNVGESAPPLSTTRLEGGSFKEQSSAATSAPPHASSSSLAPSPSQSSSYTRWLGTMTGPGGLIVQIVGGSLIGVATGLFGVGLASLSVVFFILLFRLDMKTVLGTSLLASFFRYAGGSIGYLTALQINPLMFGILVAGGGFGSIAGARIILGSGKAGDRGFKDSYVKLLQVGVLLFISYEFLLKSLIFGH